MYSKFNIRDVSISTYRQGRSRVAVRIAHIPTGWCVQSEPEWSGSEDDKRKELLLKLEQLVVNNG